MFCNQIVPPLRLFIKVIYCKIRFTDEERDKLARACSLNTACGWRLVFVLAVLKWIKFPAHRVKINTNKSVRERKRTFLMNKCEVSLK